MIDIFNLIEEVQRDPQSFKENHISTEASFKKIQEIIAENNYKIGIRDTISVLNLHAKNAEKRLTEKLVRSLLAREQFRLLIKHKKFLFSIVQDESNQAELIKKIHALSTEQINDLVLALKKK